MLGSVFVGKGACSQAISLYERILGEAQQQPSIYYNLGTCYLREQRAADALREAELYTRAKPHDAKGHVLVCDALYEQKNYPRALTECQPAERLDQVNGAIKGKIGRIYLGRRITSRRVTYLEQAVAGQQGGGQRQGSRDRSARSPRPTRRCTRRKDKLNSIGDELASLTQGSEGAGDGRAGLLPRRQRRARDGGAQCVAGARAEQRAARAPAWSRCSIAAPGSPSRRTRSARAYQLLSDAVKLTPDDLMTNRNLGLVLLMAKKYSEAEQVLARSLKKVPERHGRQPHAGARAARAAQDDGGAGDVREGGADGAAHARARSGGDLRRARADVRRQRAARSGGERARDGGQGGGRDAGGDGGAAQLVDRLLQARAGAAARSQAVGRGARRHGAGGQGAARRADGEGVGGGVVRRGHRGAQGQQDPAGGGRVGSRRSRPAATTPARSAAVRQAGRQVLRRLHAISRLAAARRSARARSSCSRSSWPRPPAARPIGCARCCARATSSWRTTSISAATRSAPART